MGLETVRAFFVEIQKEQWVEFQALQWTRHNVLHHNLAANV